MTSSNLIDKRHVPEEELHAYLDQALSRSQCVEIESHLAVCPACRGLRDEIAALRDRTTALLSTLAPGRIAMPPLAEIKEQARRRSQRRERFVRHSAWAASVVLALGFGWSAREMLVNSPADQPVPAQSSGEIEPASAAVPPTLTGSNSGDTETQRPADVDPARESAETVLAGRTVAPERQAPPTTALAR